MEDFCRTCGKAATAQNSINLYSPSARRLLNCLRNITYCWLENITGAPTYICNDCRNVVKKITSFRKRCRKIENFIVKRKVKLNKIRDHLPVITDHGNICDPLEIEESEVESVDIKVEPSAAHYSQHEKRSLNALEEGTEKFSQHDCENESHCDGYFDTSVDEIMYSEQQPSGNFSSNTTKPNPKLKTPMRSKSRSRKYTMRIGKRTMYFKLTNENQPKRIVDRERQWASARPCICEHCGRQFKDGSNLNVHLLRHSGTKNYECQQCNEKCYTLHLLRRHQLKHTEGPYKCTFCGLQYSTNSSRVRHEREACKKGRAPQSKTELIKRGERTFHCDVCDLWFLRAGNLAQHINSSNHTTNVRLKNKRAQMKEKSLKSNVTT